MTFETPLHQLKRRLPAHLVDGSPIDEHGRQLTVYLRPPSRLSGGHPWHISFQE